MNALVDADEDLRSDRSSSSSRDADASDDAVSSSPSSPPPAAAGGVGVGATFAQWARRLDDAVTNRSGRRTRAAAEALELFDQIRRALGAPSDLPASIARNVAATAASRGSIGWLTRSIATTAASDGTDRFEALLRMIREAEEEEEDGAASSFTSPLSDRDGPAYLLIPGLFGRYYPCYMWSIRAHFRRRGATCKISTAADGEGAVESNAAALCREILSLHASVGGRGVVLIGHSKGGIDAAAALSLYENKLAGVVHGLITTQCPYGGSPIATDLLATPTLTDLTSRALEVLFRRPTGAGAKTLTPIKDLTYARRTSFLRRHPMPLSFPCVSMHSETTSRSSFLYLAALYVRRRYDEASDGLVARRDAEIPGCVAVRFRGEQDHADCVFPRALSNAGGGGGGPDGEEVTATLEAFNLEYAAAPETDAAAVVATAIEEAGDKGMVPLSIARMAHQVEKNARDNLENFEANAPPGIFAVLVRAYVAWNDALPERLSGTPAPGEVRSIHWSPYDRVRVVNADP
jgi:hypothetical protein